MLQRWGGGARTTPLPVHAREIYKGPLQIGRDGDFISLPAGTTEIRLEPAADLPVTVGAR